MRFAVPALAGLATAVNLKRSSSALQSRSTSRSGSGEKMPLYIYHSESAGVSYTPAQQTEDLVRMFNSGISVVHLAFYLINAPAWPDKTADSVHRWGQMTRAQKDQVINAANNNHGKIGVSTGGATAGDRWLSVNPESYADDVCAYAKNEGFTAVDFNLEHIRQGYGANDAVYKWIMAATKRCRSYVDFLTTAPEAPLWSRAWSGGDWDYLKIAKNNKDLIFLTQYYNQGGWNGASYQEAFIQSHPHFPQVAISQIWANTGLAKDRFVWSKPFARNHVEDPVNWMDLNLVREWSCKAWNELGYRGGLMFWKYDLVNKETFFAEAARLMAPCDGSGATSTSTTTSSITSTSSVATTTATTKHPGGGGPSVGQSERDCQMAITSSNDKWAQACQKQCTFYSGVGACNCERYDRISQCVASHHSWCWEANSGGVEVPPSTPAPGSSSTVASTTATVAGTTTGPATPAGDCRSMVRGTGVHWDLDCKDRCDMYAPGGALRPWCPNGHTQAEIAECVLSQSPAGMCRSA